MVKIRIKSLLLSVVIFILLINIAHASRQALSFSDVDVKVGGKTSNNLRDGDLINEDAAPGDHLEFRIKVQNNFTSSENLKIKSITVKTTIEGIDDGSDLEDESNEFDLSPGSDKRITIKFDVPLQVDEDTFDVLINAAGDDKNGTSQEAEMRIRLDVNKKSHQLKITKSTLSPAEISCNRKNVQLSAAVLNTGSEDEKDITVRVSSIDLGIDMKDSVSELLAEPNEPESRFSKVYSFKIPDDLAAGSYPITLTASYDDDRKKAEGTPTLTVSDCQAKTPPKTKEDTSKTTSDEGNGVELITPATGRTNAPPAEQSVPPGTVVTEESFLKSNTFIAGVIIAEVIAVLVGIALVVKLFRARG